MVLVGGGGGVGGLPVLEEGGGVVGGEVILVVEGSLGDGGQVGEDVLVEWGFFFEEGGGDRLGVLGSVGGMPEKGGGMGGLPRGQGRVTRMLGRGWWSGRVRGRRLCGGGLVGGCCGIN